MTCTVFGGATAAEAQSLDNDFWIAGTAFVPKINTNVRIATRTQVVPGTDIDLERDLALDDNQVLPSVTAGGRFGRVIVGADFYKLKRDGAIELAHDISFDGTVYPVSARVGSSFDSETYRLTVGYAFVRKSDLELGAAIGLHATRFEMSIMGEASVSDETTPIVTERRHFLAPLPTVGVFGTYRIMPRLELSGRLDYLSLKVDDYDGRLINAQIGVNYAVMKNLAIGVGYRYVSYRLGIEKERWDGRIRYRLNGPAVLLQASF